MLAEEGLGWGLRGWGVGAWRGLGSSKHPWPPSEFFPPRLVWGDFKLISDGALHREANTNNLLKSKADEAPSEMRIIELKIAPIKLTPARKVTYSGADRSAMFGSEPH